MYWIDSKKCTGCGICLEECPIGAIYLVDETAQVDQDRCTECGACLSVCPQNAIQLVSKLVVDELEATPRTTGRSIVSSTFKPAATAIGTSLLSVALAKLRDYITAQAQNFFSSSSSKIGSRQGRGRGRRKRFGARRRRGL